MDYARNRATELGILERLRDRAAVQISEADIGKWTQWLQLRVAEEGDRRDVLGMLNDVGGTKRIRRLAQGRIERGGSQLK